MNQIIALIALGVMLVVGVGLIVIPVVGIRNAQAIGWCFWYHKPGVGSTGACFKTEEECRSTEHRVADILKYTILKSCNNGK